MLLEALQAGRFMRMKGKLRPLVDAIQQQARAPQSDQVASKIAKAAEIHATRLDQGPAWTPFDRTDQAVGSGKRLRPQ